MSRCGPFGPIIAQNVLALLLGFFSLLHRLVPFHITPGKRVHLDLSTMPKAGGSIGCGNHWPIPSTKGITKAPRINVNEILKQGLPSSLRVLIRQGKPQKQNPSPEPASDMATEELGDPPSHSREGYWGIILATLWYRKGNINIQTLTSTYIARGGKTALG